MVSDRLHESFIFRMGKRKRKNDNGTFFSTSYKFCADANAFDVAQTVLEVFDEIGGGGLATLRTSTAAFQKALASKLSPEDAKTVGASSSYRSPSAERKK